MATEILVPSLGESVSEATVSVWLKKVGDTVQVDEALLELETDKVTIEVPASVSGVLTELLVAEGETVTRGGLLGYISESSENPVTAPVSLKKTDDIDSSGISNQMPPSPSAIKMISENNIPLSDIQGTGKRGQILKNDVESAMSKKSSNVISIIPAEKKDSIGEERVKMTRLRQTVAKRLKDAQNVAAILTTYNEVDMLSIINLRKKYKDSFEKTHGVKLGFMGLFTKAVCQALKEIRNINAEIDGTDIVYKDYCHIGIAVGTDKGLVVPVVRDADQMSVAEIEQEISRLGKAARDGYLSVADMQGGTFTISNGGVYGSLLSSPILNPPQSGILGMHKIQERPVALNGEVVIRPMMYIALSYDHRIVDGKEAVTFLVRVKESLESPERIVLEI
ncbi:Dihydrolipoamide succinyltransferase component (E2) of 2-oxoglutarate dehydrogenase complex [Liberibacter crescens BT-1]|uniref:Dihydrolipoyllysine-residue succinyltransferase component of 2-oxoglutarate dehydrogenase complex n=1 Tax=Liberibacter crescens (strain BT-1) TaxID=1215343 RepID=L0EVN5_LIBCB|nr:2-oxoglutarate dehydrogenase complex dihydrolipoyllysine-residue succinyltransferase [Liberibacter crescens]AGA64733.1 Dihydrolipoamide succinyltransferase component (E2) of 2-oxoglutarate dehydrogenase complex [Liberibacter crescens BT-1]AMC12817.1 dihydrolipoamide succinyltransferase [Liberibacter crescens]